MAGIVVALSRSSTHTFSKRVEASIRLVAGLGVEGDPHFLQGIRFEVDRRGRPELR
jgi:hypothetical protein